jgi:Cdc6-like AAA superfamily ATPase
MPSINQTIEICTSILRQSPKAVPFLRGAPGMGKSDASLQIGDQLDVPRERQLVVHVNNHDVVDFNAA